MVNTGTSLNVEYDYENGGGSTNTVRRKSITYPGPTTRRQINYVYNPGIDGSLSRVSQINDGATGQASYAYLGLGTVAIMNLLPPQLRYTLAGSARYDKLDTLDRLTGLTWFNYGNSTFPERMDYTYDRLGNRLSKQRLSFGTTGNDEKYSYDGLYRLRTLDRGTLSGGSITSPTFKQNWDNPSSSNPGLDATGNWTNFREANAGGSWTLDQSRGHDKANTLTGFPTTSTGTAWATPSHDVAGNMTVGAAAERPGQRLRLHVRRLEPVGCGYRRVDHGDQFLRRPPPPPKENGSHRRGDIDPRLLLLRFLAGAGGARAVV